MTQFYRYRNAIGAASSWAVDLGNDAVRLGELEGLTEVAEHCQTGTSTVTIDDPDADVGHSSDAILGHQRFELEETDMASGNRRVFTALIGDRNYRRRADAPNDSLRLGASREIDVELHDLNAYLSLNLFHGTGANRPEETVGERLTWLLSESIVSGIVFDSGLVQYPTNELDKSDYRGKAPANVLGDCELEMGYNAFVYWDETNARPALYFNDPNTSTDFTSTLRISNVLSDLDTVTAAQFLTGTTFAPSRDGNLKRSPQNLASSVFLPYAQSFVFESLDTTVDTYGRKTAVAPSADVKKAPRATAIAQRFLRENATEEDRITCEVQLPTNKVNLIRAGHRIEVKFSHLPGYESFTWCRVARRTIMQKEQTDDRYTLSLELSPQEVPPEPDICSDLYPPTASDTFYPLGSFVSDGVVYYWRSGFEVPSVPNPGMVGSWHFSALGAGGLGTVDYAGDCVGNRLILMAVGNGTWTIETERYGGTTRALFVAVGPELSSSATIAFINSGDSIEVTIDDTVDGDCIRVVVIGDRGLACGSKWGWSEAVWVAA